ncbi:MAG: anhydro-N-acetylmuramic acid kinase [Bacteroidales bacterium]|nr:anhydro-N-acetylmuramic acid kinase [Bacteroidales bacterium]
MILNEKFSEWEYGLGLMSGTSLDGVDMAYCGFRNSEDGWKFQILNAKTFSYSADLLKLIREMPKMSAENLIAADRRLGAYYGELCRSFNVDNNLKPAFIASHGHTIFHNPLEGYTFQAGHGAEIASRSGIPCINDFRSIDVSKGGQGAPLVPIGDELLFSEYDALVNLGGFSNISFRKNGKRIAYDICPVNMALNYFAEKLSLSYDEDGKMAREGALDLILLKTLHGFSYYANPAPKSLGREDFEHRFLPLIDEYSGLSAIDVLRTLTEHIAIQIADSTAGFKNVLFTGGGVKNKFLAEKLREKLGDSMHIPSELLIDYKEALVFAFLGLLRLKGEINILSSATGASSDSCSGMLHLP